MSIVRIRVISLAADLPGKDRRGFIRCPARGGASQRCIK